jgi:aspartyl-tRNA(Asn)/glutamyl-tRNA(Gln) amidotransferase subunit A
MNLLDPRTFSVAEARRSLDAREITATELTRALLDRISLVEGRLHALLAVTGERALEDAARADEELSAGVSKPLLGIPIVLKDIFATKGIRTTCASRILENFVPPYDADSTERLAAAGAILMGKANMDEFAMGSSNENSAYGACRNPWDLDRVPGGSSGGSAVAVAAGEALASLGTDTGGSIRLPAAFTGVSGLKPTYGRVSRYGVIAYASSLDQVGPFAKTAEDLAMVLGVIAGHDPKDSTSAEVAVPDYRAELSGDLKGLKLGLPRQYFEGGISEDVERAVREALEVLRGRGAELVEVDLPHTPYAVATYYLIATAEASSNLGRYDGVRYGHRTAKATNLLEMYRESRVEGFGPEVKRRIILGTYALSAGYYDAYYRKALQARTLIREDFEKAYAHCDAIVTPTAPQTAFRLGEKASDPLSMYLSDVFTNSANLAGIPGLVVPCGFDTKRLPIGLQILAPSFGEATALKIGDAYQQDTAWHQEMADLTGDKN